MCKYAKGILFSFLLVGQGMKWANCANIWPKMTKKAKLGPNLAVFRANILILMGGSKSFGNFVTEKPPRHLVCIVYGRAWDQMDQKCQYLAKKANFGQNLAVYGPIIHFWGRWSSTFGILISGNQ